MLVAGTPTQGIAYLDGVRLHRALTAGIRRVLLHQEELNRINVFPVADADTGTNLAATPRSVLEATGNQVNPHAGPGSLVVAVQPYDPPRAGQPEVECP